MLPLGEGDCKDAFRDEDCGGRLSKLVQIYTPGSPFFWRYIEMENGPSVEYDNGQTCPNDIQRPAASGLLDESYRLLCEGNILILDCMKHNDRRGIKTGSTPGKPSDMKTADSDCGSTMVDVCKWSQSSALLHFQAPRSKLKSSAFVDRKPSMDDGRPAARQAAPTIRRAEEDVYLQTRQAR